MEASIKNPKDCKQKYQGVGPEVWVSTNQSHLGTDPLILSGVVLITQEASELPLQAKS